MIAGVYVPLLTAFATDGGVDPGACVEHARWLVDAHVDGLVPFGTSGEGPSLSLREKRSVLAALAAAFPTTSIVPAITEASLDSALQLVEAVNDMPAAGIMLLPPFYFRPLGDDGLRRYVEKVLAASAHPVLLYHIPELGPAVPAQVVADLPVWGVKDSSGDLSYTFAVLATGKQVMIGAEHRIVAGVSAGAQGSIPGLANVLPEHFTAGVAAARDGDIATAEKILAQVIGFRDSMLAAAGPQGWISAMKVLAQSRHGAPLGAARIPLPGAPEGVAGLLGPQLRDAIGQLAAITGN